MKKMFQTAPMLLAVLLVVTACNNQSATADATSKDSAAKDTTAVAAGPDVTQNWKLGVQMWTFRMFSFTDALNKVDSSGIKHIEAFFGQKLGGSLPGEFGTGMNADTRTKLKELLRTKGIDIVAMGVIAPKDKAEWIKAFDLAKEFGLSYITAEPTRAQWNMVDSLAGAYAIKVAIHDHPKPNNYWTPDSVLVAVAGHPNIGSCADVGHWSRNGLNPVDCLKKLEGHVFGVHLKDIKKFDDPKADDTTVSKGVIQFPPIFAELKRQGFSGMFSIEHESNWYHSVPDVIETRQYWEAQVAALKK